MKNQFTKWIGVCCSLILLTLISTTHLSAQYCEFSGVTPADDHITNVTFAGINNSSAATGYSDFTEFSGTVVPGVSYDVSATMGNDDQWPETLTIYIDWDQSETFDAEERYNIGACDDLVCSTDGISGSISVPAAALPGETRMRVIGKFNTPPVGPCTTDAIMSFGEVEDYTLLVEAGECTPANFTYTTTTDCDNDTYSVSSVINDYGTNSFVTIFVTRSDAVPATTVNVPSGAIPVGSTVPIIEDVPNGVTVSISAEGQNEICNTTANFAADICPPNNDLPCDAVSLALDGTPYVGTNIGATADVGEVAPPQGGCGTDSTWCDNFGELNGLVDNSVWLTFVGPESGRVRLDGCNEGASFDTQFAVYTASDCSDYSTFEFVGANDDRPFATFGACDFGLFRSGLDLCVEPGQTYYLQVDGYAGAEGDLAVTATEIDGSACSCVPAVVPAVFTFADTQPYCLDGTVGYTIAFYSPEDLGSSEFFVYRYSYVAGDTITVNVPAGGTFEAEDIIPLETLTYIDIHLSDENCDAVNTGFPISGQVVQDEFACDPDCEGTPGGSVGPGSACDADGTPGAYNADCECIPSPENDDCVDATPAVCGGNYIGSTASSASYPEGQPFCVTAAPTLGNGGVWYSYTPTNDTDIDIDLSGSDFDTKLFLYSGTCEALICETGNDDGGDGLDSRIQTTLTGGIDYLIFVTGIGTARGDFVMNISCTDLLCSPTISSITLVNSEGEPVDCAVLGEYYVEVTLDGGTEVSYQVSTGSSPVTVINANGTGIVGPISSGNPTINVVGTDNQSCGTSQIFDPTICISENDLPCDAIALMTDGSVYLGNNLGATADEGEVAAPQGGCGTDSTWCDNFGGLNGSVDNSVWFTFVGPESGRVRLAGCNEGASFDTQFAVYTASDCDDYSTYEFVGANDDQPFATFGSCGFSTFVSGLDLCVEPGETYYLQVDGYTGAEGILALSVTELDGAACNCVPAVVPAVFTFADTQPYCVDGTVGYTIAFYSPEDLGSSEFFVYRYSYVPGDTITVNVPAGGTFEAEDIIPLETETYIDIHLSDENCAEANTGFPISGLVTQDEFACDPDCEGTPGGPVGPGSVCDADGVPGVYGDDCECIPSPENDDVCSATSLECGIPVVQTTLAATQSLAPLTCENFTAAQAFDVWFTFTADGSSSYILNETLTDDLVLEAFSSNGCDDLVSIACADIPETIDFGVLDAGVYYVRAYAYSAFLPAYNISIQLDCEINDAAEFSGTVGWNTNCDDRESTVTFYEPNTAIVAATYVTSVNSAGEFTIPSVLVGTYDVIVDVPGYLNKGLADVVTVVGSNSVDFGAIVFGDTNDNNGFNVSDFSVVLGAFGSATGDANYNLFADLNCNGQINASDFSLLTTIGFGQSGAVAPLP